jgi:hypothetical protein
LASLSVGIEREFSNDILGVKDFKIIILEVEINLASSNLP